MGGGGGGGVQLKFWPFVSCRLNFRLFFSYQLNGSQ